ncbi:hypothetical protein QN277_020866 [Acacia crassicarpa]|uniref:RNase H type-1 domain-containing protein n=1 Tax=Acacia crassicarpa TaxID=499986 RepID=A0AAE1KFI3_9FABA|nr:hypothetical protein QN277_020866 [Acacia crassicarpa]
MLWKWRNKSIFEQGFSRPLNPASSLLSSVHQFVLCQSVDSSTLTNSVQQVSWRCPPLGWTKLNVDGSASSATHIARCGGVLRDVAGNWLAGFSVSLGCCDPYEAEEWALLKGLEVAWSLGVRRVIAESDSQNLINLLLGEDGSSAISLVAFQIKEFMCRPWEIKLQHVSRFQNQVADYLARDPTFNSTFIEYCPSSLRALVHQDCIGIIPPSD